MSTICKLSSSQALAFVILDKFAPSTFLLLLTEHGKMDYNLIKEKRITPSKNETIDM